jgi:hypothetical protein
MDKKSLLSVTSEDRVQNLITEAYNELSTVLPEIEELEQFLQKLKELKDRKYKLESLIINLKSILPKESVTETHSIDVSEFHVKTISKSRSSNVNKISLDTINGRKVFVPDVALSNAKNYLRTKNNVNYEIYKAIVFNTGEATTDEIKYYLIKNNIKQPKTGKGFEEVPLKEISSRTNYLVRKGLLISYTPGVFSTVFGWEEVE